MQSQYFKKFGILFRMVVGVAFYVSKEIVLLGRIGGEQVFNGRSFKGLKIGVRLKVKVGLVKLGCWSGDCIVGEGGWFRVLRIEFWVR